MRPTSSRKPALATSAIHADDHLADGRNVATPISVSTTFKYLAESDGNSTSWDPLAPSRHIYSRYTQPTLSRSEAVLTALVGGYPALCFASGLAAGFAVLLKEKPNVIAVGKAYHGCVEGIRLYAAVRPETQVIDLDVPFPSGKRLLVWLETPSNPTGESTSIAAVASRAHAAGGRLVVDSTFAPPPLQDPFAHGADIVMHSGTKYLAGHSDALMGVVLAKNDDEWREFWHVRTYTGSTPGSLETWLLLRSLRTLPLRVKRQAETATALAQWLASLTRATEVMGSREIDAPAGVVEKVWHSVLQTPSLLGAGKQLEGGPACFAILLTSEAYARRLPGLLKLFVPATSLGGVESLAEQRIVSDPGAEPRLVRLSIGLEDLEDLKADLAQAFSKLKRGESKL